MAGDWIKMRTNLWDDPRVSAMADQLDCGEATVIGGLYWLWSVADDHSEDGFLPGMSFRSIDRKTGIEGFAAALSAIHWIEEMDNGIQIPKFDEHNGRSAKKRAVDAKRQISHRTQADSRKEVTESVRDSSLSSVTKNGQVRELEKEKEKEKEKDIPPPPYPLQGDFSAAAAELLISRKVEMPKPAIEAARSAGATLGDIQGIVQHYDAHPGAWGPAALQRRIANFLPGQSPGTGWPKPAKEFQVAQSKAKSQARQAQEAKRDQGEREKAKHAASVLECRFGPMLDAMSELEVKEFLRSHDSSGLMLRQFRQRGRGDPAVRIAVLKLIEKHLREPEPCNGS